MAHDENTFYSEAWQQGRLLVQRCRGCRQLRYPPCPLCRSCREPEWDPVPVSGRGEVYSYVIPRKPPLGDALPSPVVALIALDEGIRIVANLVDVAPADVHFGQRVQLDFLVVGDGSRVPVFRPA